jgi:aminomethyltransferase
MEAGKEFNIAPAAPSQINRVEGGMLSYGSDMSLNENPYDLNLGKFVNLEKKADFISKKALEKIKSEGPKKELVGIEIQCDPFKDFVADHLLLYFNNRVSGKITSSIYSPRLKKNIGLAIINKRSREVTEGYSVKINDESLNIKIKELPFLRNK